MERTYAALHRDDDVDVWALFWRPAHDTGWHDHDTSSGAVHVVEGVLEEHALLIAQPERRTRYGGRRRVHVRPVAHPPRDLRLGRTPSPSTRTLRPCGGWASTRSRQDGALHRMSVSYADELRPLELDAA